LQKNELGVVFQIVSARVRLGDGLQQLREDQGTERGLRIFGFLAEEHVMGKRRLLRHRHVVISMGGGLLME
jgi:hypothetical protein